MNLVALPYGQVKEKTSRAYSLSSPPSDSEAVEFIIRLVPGGIVTTYVFEHLKEGDPAALIGPFGDFYLRESDREIIFVAGGSGLAPVRSIVLDMIGRGIAHRKATFFFGAVGLRDLYCVEEFQSIAAKHPWFSFVPALSGKDEGHPHERGLITEVLDRHCRKLDRHEAYLCGNPGMIDACVDIFTANGMPQELIYYDKFR